MIGTILHVSLTTEFLFAWALSLRSVERILSKGSTNTFEVTLHMKYSLYLSDSSVSDPQWYDHSANYIVTIARISFVDVSPVCDY
ncbi:hypothetical protein V1517DRAFT_325542 [Lipomyces orientalis]|uniref:Uncharacterized protein n=1 Tax=Lipomyces orientalis TaxID=1233043 RepID=A0ACC3TLB7_9ASCO